MLAIINTNMTWYHPKYYAELRAARKKLQAQEGASAKRTQHIFSAEAPEHATSLSEAVRWAPLATTHDNIQPIVHGKNTKDALTSGFFWGYEGLINNIIKKICKKNGINFKIILTGGFSYLFKRLVEKSIQHLHEFISRCVDIMFFRETGR